MSAAPATRETKNAYSCDTPRSRGLTGSRSTAPGFEAEGPVTDRTPERPRAVRNTRGSTRASCWRPSRPLVRRWQRTSSLEPSERSARPDDGGNEVERFVTPDGKPISLPAIAPFADDGPTAWRIPRGTTLGPGARPAHVDAASFQVGAV